MQYKNQLGTFTFDDDVQLSHMKLIVANVTGQFLNPKPGEPKLTCEVDCIKYIREHGGLVLSPIKFKVAIKPEHLERKQHDLAWTERADKALDQLKVKIDIDVSRFQGAVARIMEAFPGSTLVTEG